LRGGGWEPALVLCCVTCYVAVCMCYEQYQGVVPHVQHAPILCPTYHSANVPYVSMQAFQVGSASCLLQHHTHVQQQDAIATMTSSMCALCCAVALQDAAKGVQHLHSKSIVHGDLVSTTGGMQAGPLPQAECCSAQQRLVSCGHCSSDQRMQCPSDNCVVGRAWRPGEHYWQDARRASC
jgi:hypothetical protein